MKQAFFVNNRSAAGKSVKGGLIVVTGYTALQRGNDSAHRFEQEANFWYFTGISEPDWQVIIDGSTHKNWLVAPDIDEVHRTFDGGLSNEEAMQISGINNVISHRESETLLRELAKKHSIAYTLGEHPHADHFNFVENPAPKKLGVVLERIFNSTQDCWLEIAKLRAIKQPEEIAAIKRAVRLTTEVFDIVKDQLPKLKYEYEVEAEFDYNFKKHGASHAYDPIVAGGQNACILHYNKNTDKLKKGTLLLLDIGARVDGYAADISRTFAIGQPTKRQIAVQAAVESAHLDIIKLLRPGVRVTTYQEKVDEIMKQALLKLGLIKDVTDDNNYRRYFPHAISHGLGIDVHDSLGQPTTFEPGMVLTVEPGIYIPGESIGVRIEDDILITQTGFENLSRRLPSGL